MNKFPDKKIVVTLLLREAGKDGYTSDSLIKDDIRTELNCCWNGFEIQQIEIIDVG